MCLKILILKKKKTKWKVAFVKTPVWSNIQAYVKDKAETWMKSYQNLILIFHSLTYRKSLITHITYIIIFITRHYLIILRKSLRLVPNKMSNIFKSMITEGKKLIWNFIKNV